MSKSFSWAHTRGVSCEDARKDMNPCFRAVLGLSFPPPPSYSGTQVASLQFGGSNYAEGESDRTLGWKGRKTTALKAVGVFRESFISESAVLWSSPSAWVLGTFISTSQVSRQQGGRKQGCCVLMAFTPQPQCPLLPPRAHVWCTYGLPKRLVWQGSWGNVLRS